MDSAAFSWIDSYPSDNRQHIGTNGHSNRLSKVMLPLVSHMFIPTQNGDIFPSSNRRDVLPSTKFAPLHFFLLSSCYPLKNHYQCATHYNITCDFSLGSKMIVKKNSRMEQVLVFQPGKICEDWFSKCNWVKWKTCSSSWLKQELLKFILHCNYFAMCMHSDGKWTVVYCTVLYCIVLYCSVLYCTVLYCSPGIGDFSILKIFMYFVSLHFSR